MRYEKDTFYEMVFPEAIDDVWCGECITNTLADKSLSDEEQINESNVSGEVESDEPYQCAVCSKQNAAYEELGNEA
jgi:phosphotransferase system IIB component